MEELDIPTGTMIKLWVKHTNFTYTGRLKSQSPAFLTIIEEREYTSHLRIIAKEEIRDLVVLSDAC